MIAAAVVKVEIMVRTVIAGAKPDVALTVAYEGRVEPAVIIRVGIVIPGIIAPEPEAATPAGVAEPCVVAVVVTP